MSLPPTQIRPVPFDEAVRALREHRWRPEVSVHDIPAPQRIAPQAAASQADVVIDGEDVGSGRLVLLHDPAGNEAWEGTFRLVCYARADVDLEMVTDPLLAEVGWEWLNEALDQRGAAHVAASGTVTAVSSRSFGELSTNPDRAEVEIRASWTPLLESGGLEPHLSAWQDVLCLTAGLPPLPDGVVLLSARAGGSRVR